MAYKEQKYNSRLVYNPTYPDIRHSVFKKCDWKGFYWDTNEAIPNNAPELREKEVDICLFMDGDHAGDKKSCRARSGFLMYINFVPVQQHSKK